MRNRRLLILLVLPLTAWMPAEPVRAQRSELIEDLFRTIANAQLEREQRKRIEAEQAAERVPGPLPQQPQRVPIPPEGTITDRGGPRPGPGGGSINVRSRQAAEFAQALVDFNRAINPMVHDLRRDASGNASLVRLLPEAYQVAADSRTLLQRCEGLAALEPLVSPYSELDARWRQLSFRLRSLDGLSNRCTAGIRSCDQLVGRMSRQLGIQPQFDRHALHDLMLRGATYMQCLLDDLQLAPIADAERQRLTHDCRLLRQRLLAEADHVGQTSYEDVVTRFTELVSSWSDFSQQIYALNDPHLRLRLDRIRQCGDETYAVLWMPPPYNASTLTAASQRILKHCSDVLEQLTIRSLGVLPPADQTRILQSSQRMYEAARRFSQLSSGGAARTEMQQGFARIDQEWALLRPKFYTLTALSRATLSGMEYECQYVRNALGVTPTSSPIDYEDLIQLAAGLEGTAAYLDADIHRYNRYLQPASYRSSITQASGEFLHHARQLHERLSRHADLASLQREAELMLDGWEQLSRDLGHIESHGLSERRAESLQRDHNELVPLVAKIAAALVER